MQNQFSFEIAHAKRDIASLKEALERAETVIIGAGAGLSTSAGYVYAGERFHKYFGDFASKYHFTDMYSGGFYPFATLEERWAYWSRYIYINRYMAPPKPVYDELFALVKDKDYFVLTTNADHCFQRAGFDKQRLFYTQGDYGLWQCGDGCGSKTFDNEPVIRKMVEAQGFVIEANGPLTLPENVTAKTFVPTELVPRCSECGEPMAMNLRSDDNFVEDKGWHAAANRYGQFLDQHQKSKTLFLELGTGMNTPTIIKFSFWQMAYGWPDAVYACVNLGEAYAPKELETKAICLNDDIGNVLKQL